MEPIVRYKVIKCFNGTMPDIVKVSVVLTEIA